MRLVILIIRLDEYRKFNTTPMTPSFLKFPFNETLSENVVLRVTANNENCIAISTQEPKVINDQLPT